jgi:hypothetical protein
LLKISPTDLDPLFEAYRAAKARHDAAIHALKAASNGRKPPDPELVKRQVEAARDEIAAFDELRSVRD